MSEQNPSEDAPKQPLTGREQYNVVADTVTGLNYRWKDNLYQGLAVLACLILGGVIGLIVAEQRVMGALLGGFLGMVAGLFGSGIVLMILRGMRHARGKHD